MDKEKYSLGTNGLSHIALCSRCGAELFAGDFFAFWDGAVCSSCMRERLFGKTDGELAGLLGISFGLIEKQWQKGG